MRTSVATVERFWSRVEKTDTCWVWTHTKNSKGYGFTRVAEPLFRNDVAHRIAYELVLGSIPEGMQLDHLCRNKWCVNPDHLEPVTNAENQRRAAACRTHCANGHLWTPENTYIAPGRPTSRHCRRCGIARTMAYKRRKRSRAAVPA